MLVPEAVYHLHYWRQHLKLCCAGDWAEVVHKVRGRMGVWLDSCAVLPC